MTEQKRARKREVRAWLFGLKVCRRLLPRLAHHIFDLHRFPALPFAFFSRFHEGDEFNGFLGRDGRLAGLEKMADLFVEFLVAAFAELGGDAFLAEDDRAMIALAVADAAEGSDAVVLPRAGDQFATVFFAPGMYTRDGFAARPHEGIENFDAVDAVPVKVREMLQNGARSPRVHADDFADLGIGFERDDLRAKAQRRTGKPRNVILLRKLGDGD